MFFMFAFVWVDFSETSGICYGTFEWRYQTLRKRSSGVIMEGNDFRGNTKSSLYLYNDQNIANNHVIP